MANIYISQLLCTYTFNLMPNFQNEPRPVPFALKECTKQVVDCLVASGYLHRVESSAWTAPIVPVPKKNGQIHI